MAKNPKQYWLMKTEPDVFSIRDLEKKNVAPWEGVRNYQARNFMRDGMKAGDGVFVYHSSCDIPGVAGLARVRKEGHPDYFAWDKKSKYYDPKSPQDNPRWWMVELEFVRAFKEVIPLSLLKQNPGLKNMWIFSHNRLSVSPVTEKEWDIILKLEA